jgi:hypothetical protein
VPTGFVTFDPQRILELARIRFQKSPATRMLFGRAVVFATLPPNRAGFARHKVASQKTSAGRIPGACETISPQIGNLKLQHYVKSESPLIPIRMLVERREGISQCSVVANFGPN